MGNKALRHDTIERAIQLYDAIRWYMEDEEFSPSIPELSVMADMSSKSIVWSYLRILRGWGWITWTPETVRTIRLTRPTDSIVEMPKPRGKRKAKNRVA